MKLNGLKINKVWEGEEPQHCEYGGCKEDLNGLNRFYINPFRDIQLSIWLCEKHAILFERKLEQLEKEK